MILNRMLVLVFLGSAVLCGCEKAGKEIDEAIETAGDAVQDAGNAVEDATDPNE